MNAPTSASAAYEGSLPAKSAFEHPARIEDSDKSFVTRLASSSVEKLKEMREVLRSEGERVQREVGNYAQLAQAALAATKTVTESVALERSTNVADQVQTSTSRRSSGGREKLRRWPAPAD